jgi:hypothetical protein
VRQLHDETIELLEAVFSMWSLPRCYKQETFKLIVRRSPSSKDVNTEVEEAMALKAVTRR